jgi:histidine triad (HIT) family protein
VINSSAERRQRRGRRRGIRAGVVVARRRFGCVDHKNARENPKRRRCRRTPKNQRVTNSSCLFCQIVRRELTVRIVFEDDNCVGFLDHRPVFPGHCLLVPKEHYETLIDLPAQLVEPVFHDVQLLAHAVEKGMQAHGTFVAMNNRVSQSVPHLHVHVVPRRRKDGLRGFFWPRYPYKSGEEAELVQASIRAAVDELRR